MSERPSITLALETTFFKINFLAESDIHDCFFSGQETQV